MEAKKTILIVAAHPDDEILGCGGTMARFSSEGHEVHILIMAEGLTSRDMKRDRDSKSDELSQLARAANEACLAVGAKSVELLDFPDNRMDSVDRLDVTKAIENRIEKIKPSIVLTHFGNDLNIDHRVVNDSVITACRAYPGQTVKELYFFEVPSSTEWQLSGLSFNPDYFVRLGKDEFARKQKALEMYKSEMRNFPHARSIEAVEALARWRGACIGHEYGEAFKVGRIIK